jgi:hypothetical protein
MTTFQPSNKRLYTGKHGRLLMSMVGRPCIVLGEVAIPVEQAKDRKPFTQVHIRFPNCKPVFAVRPQDVAKGE